MSQKIKTKKITEYVLLVGGLVLLLFVGCENNIVPKQFALVTGKKKPKQVNIVETKAVLDVMPTLPSEQRLYAYSGNARRDVFKSLLTKKKTMRTVKEKRKLTPLEKFDISEFKLVGVLWGEYGKRGVVQIADGKVFNVKVGKRIGKNGGRVKEILSDRIVIEEKHYDILESEVFKKIVLRIRPEEEAVYNDF